MTPSTDYPLSLNPVYFTGVTVQLERCDHCGNRRELSDYFCPTTDKEKKNPYRLCGECLVIWKETEKEII
jgi:hypothetical protein